MSSPVRFFVSDHALAASTASAAPEAAAASTASAEAAARAHAPRWPERCRTGELRRGPGELLARHLPLIADMPSLSVAHDIRRQLLAGRRTLCGRALSRTLRLRLSLPRGLPLL